PSYFCNIIEEMERQGMDPRDSSLRIGIFGAEPWTGQMRKDIEQRAGIDALDIYGLSEVMGPGVANECIETKDGPVIWEDHFYPEIIDPESGAVLPDGELGELVFTSLSKEALPIIRYRTRDITRLLPPTSRSMRRMARIVGRSDDMMIVRGVNVFPTQIEELILRIPALTPHYVLELTRNGRLDNLTIHVEADQHDAAANAAHMLGEAVKANIGISAQVRIAPLGSLERSAGKAQRILDNRSLAACSTPL
ncbi:MAG TPA: phenylacetate--CoA ligase, partial [Steroidobacter sp.]|nr:phenylacetate--CoA ligase [Steroidobacter sp.]